MNYIFSLFLLSFIGLTFAQTCNDENEEYKGCGTACPRSCAHPEKFRNCIDVCKSGCFCKEPFIRDESTGKCVLQAKCVHTCYGLNEYYTDCGTACPTTCANMNRTGIICPDNCVQGCFCNAGYVRDNQNNCILKTKCPHTYEEKTCAGPNEVYHSCGTACPQTCAHPEKRGCIEICKEGCFCKEPFIRDESTGKCVLTKDCHHNYEEEMCAQPNEVYRFCGTACPRTCAHPEKIRKCIDVCKSGCFCEEPFIRDEKSGKCVIESKCTEY